MSAESERHVEAVLASIRILECFESDVGLRATQLHERTGLQYSRIMRLTGTLAARGMLTLDRESGKYFLGPSLFRLGQLVAPRYKDLTASVGPILDNLVAETDRTAMFSVTDGVSRLVLCKREPSMSLRYTVSEGQSRPLASGASGRVMLVFGAEDLRTQVLSQMDVDERQVLKSQFSAIRKRGFDVSVSELTPEAFAVAYPVMGPGGRLIGVLTLAGPSSALTEETRDRYVTLLRQQASLVASVGVVPLELAPQ